MILYHGSNISVEKPRILKRLRALDFGGGFYLTFSEEQAGRWARTVTRRRREGSPIINLYEFDLVGTNDLEVMKFTTANEEWLDFVVRNRKEIPPENQYDLVIGPVANDATLPVIDDYMDGKYTQEEAVKRLLPQKLTDQYAFLTVEALSILEFKGGINV